MNPIPQQFLISGTALFLLALLIGFAIPALRNPRMGMSVHVAGVQSGMALWALGLMWQRVALPDGAQRATQLLAVLGLYAIFIALTLAAAWGTSRVSPAGQHLLSRSYQGRRFPFRSEGVASQHPIP